MRLNESGGRPGMFALYKFKNEWESNAPFIIRIVMDNCNFNP